MTEKLRNDTIINLGAYMGTLFRDSYVDEVGCPPDRDTIDGLDRTALSEAWGRVWRLLEIENDKTLFDLFSVAFDATVFDNES